MGHVFRHVSNYGSKFLTKIARPRSKLGLVTPTSRPSRYTEKIDYDNFIEETDCPSCAQHDALCQLLTAFPRWPLATNHFAVLGMHGWFKDVGGVTGQDPEKQSFVFSMTQTWP